jgi:hypothetical protein
MIAVKGDFSSIVRKCNEANSSAIPLFMLPEQMPQFSAHLRLPEVDGGTQDAFITSHEHGMPSHDDELNVVLDRVQQWLKKISSLPSTKQKLMNASRPLRLTKNTTDPSAVLQYIATQNKIKFCVPCKKFALTPAAYVREQSISSNTSDVVYLAAKTVDWLCQQHHAPSTVKALLTQIASFNTTKELSFEEVWNALLAQGVVEMGGDNIKYHLDVIQVPDRYIASFS